MKKFILFVLFVFLLGYGFFSINPKVSVILLTYNRQDMISVAIDSILKQTYQNFELIVINDGSNDNTKQILQEYAKKDKRII
ncbi:MAG: glycosyltransferase family 2 protein, partial [Alphaproteobacteria bacterium]|nr:glycosyltransferase family 2 protein [Alphaproteobacteria bacterium]